MLVDIYSASSGLQKAHCYASKWQEIITGSTLGIINAFCFIYKCIVFSFSPADEHTEFCNGAVGSRGKREKDINAHACFSLILIPKGMSC